jgi:tRNA pseudouridine32 synthase/23S rRNA pseudouridine746 synthase
VVVAGGPWPGLLAFLTHRFPTVPEAVWRQRLDAGDITDGDGRTASASDTATAGRRLYYYREVPDEPVIPFQEEVIWQDAHLLVVDKPHFLPVVPSGKHVRETLLARLQLRLNLPDLSPAHRIDKDTAGLVMFTTQPAGRNAYQALFRERHVSKTYECIAPWKPGFVWPVHRESRIGDAEHFMQQAEVPGEVNAITDIELLEVAGDWARYALRPLTGQRHQLRLHMYALGLPILFDGIYPVLTPEGANDYRRPLQLLARTLEFVDPLSGEQRRFESRRTLMPLEEVPPAR